MKKFKKSNVNMILRKGLGFCCFGGPSDIFKGSEDIAVHNEKMKSNLITLSA